MSSPYESVFFSEHLTQLATSYVQAAESGADLDAIDELIKPIVRSWVHPDASEPELEAQILRAERELASLPTMPTTTQEVWRNTVTDEESLGHSPSVAVAGAVQIAWLDFDGTNIETLFRASLDLETGTSSESVELATGTRLIRPTITSRDKPVVAFTHRPADSTSVFVAGPGGEQEVASSALNQAVTVDSKGTTHVAFQQFHAGKYQIFHVEVDDHGSSEPQLLSTHAPLDNHWDPSIACSADGSVWVTYSRFHKGAYGVELKQRNPHGMWESATDLTVHPHLHALHPTIATSGADVVVAYDEVDIMHHGDSGETGYKLASTVGNPHRRMFPDEAINSTIRLVRLNGKTMEHAEGPVPRDSSQHHGAACYPMVALTEDGTTWIAYRRRRALPLRHQFYQGMLAHTSGIEGWQISALPDSDGPASEICIAHAEGGDVVVAWHSDGRAVRDIELVRKNVEGKDWGVAFGGDPGDRREPGCAAWDVGRGAGAVHIARIHAIASGPLETQAYPADTLAAVDRSGDRVRTTLSLAGSELSLFWGDLHRHSNISRCAAGLDIDILDHYRFAHDIGDYDFWAMTEHSEHTSEFRWFQLKKLANIYLNDGEHVPMVGFEWTSFDHGHMNVIYRGDDGPIFSSNDDYTRTPTQLWAALGDAEAMTIPHHPAAIHYPTNWEEFDERFVRLVEVFQAATGSHESTWCFRQHKESMAESGSVAGALKRGYKLGFIASTDHLYGASYAGVYSESLSRPDVYDALYDRRCFAATTTGVVPLLEVDGHPLGSTVSAGSNRVSYGAIVADGSAISQVLLMHNSEIVGRVASCAARDDEWPVDIRWLSEQGSGRDNSGSAEVSEGAEIIPTEYVSPDVTSISSTKITWSNELPVRFGSFRNPPGVGGLGITVRGDPEATLTVSVAGRTVVVPLRDLATTHLQSDPEGSLGVKPGVGGLTALETETVPLSVDLDTVAGDYVYVLAIRSDGEAAWSSPIWFEN